MNTKWSLKQGDYAGTRARRAAFRELMAEHGHVSKIVSSELVFGELITNAVRYGHDPMAVEVHVHDGKMRIRVDNCGDCFDLTEAMLKEPSTEGGRGLRIIEALSDKVTVERSARHPCRITVDLSI
jgi:anti-sigma regulatory factor (Ser/Thr protein kinase)